MRIGVDATSWANERGYGRFTRELVTAMARLSPHHQFICFLDARSSAVFAAASPNVCPVVVRQSVAPTLAAASSGRRSVADMLRLTNAVRATPLDVFFSPTVYGYFPLPPGLPALVTVHDAIVERFPSLTVPARRDRLFWTMKVRLALQQSRLVLTVSQYAARQIARYLRVPRNRIRVAVEGVAPQYRRSESDTEIRAAAADAGVPDGMPWLMYVGGFGPHKHVDVLVRAHAALVRHRTSAPIALLLVGSQSDVFHQDVPALQHVIQMEGTESLVRWPGFVPDDQLRHLHSGAIALVLPSASEGFGLPAVEAARCGTPVIATTESPLPELLEGGGLFVRPGDVRALESALGALASDEPARREMGQRAMTRAMELSWDRCAREALAAIEETAGRR
jgi:glycosyltransferase involved in cell wall biosynthesis